MACAIDQTANAAKKICWGRGDSDAKGFIVQDSAGAAVDITGFTFTLSVDTRKNPDDASTLVFALGGSITDAANGVVEFTPTITDTDITPGRYYYDIQQINLSSAKKTLIKGKVTIVQDLSKA